MYGAGPSSRKYGKYILMSRHDLDLADRGSPATGR